jgi:hypothetical protein
MRRAISIAIFCCLAFCGASAGTPRFDYHNLTKKEIVRRLGIPHQIWIGTGPDPETWFYYWEDKKACFRVEAIGFRNGRVSSYGADPDYDPGRLLSTDRPGDLAKITRWLADNHLIR